MNKLMYLFFVLFAMLIILKFSVVQAGDWGTTKQTLNYSKDHSKSITMRGSRQKAAKELNTLFNKVYPKTINMKYGGTLKRYENSTVYYNRTIYPTGAPKYVEQMGDYQLYKRKLRQYRRGCYR